MKKATENLLDKAARSLRAAELLFKEKDYDFSGSRAYYAMFYAAEAALLERDKTFSKHTGVISGFYHEFVKPGVLPHALHDAFHQAFDDRNDGDYMFMEQFPEADAIRLIADGKVFLEAIIKLLKPD